MTAIEKVATAVASAVLLGAYGWIWSTQNALHAAEYRIQRASEEIQYLKDDLVIVTATVSETEDTIHNIQTDVTVLRKDVEYIRDSMDRLQQQLTRP